MIDLSLMNICARIELLALLDKPTIAPLIVSNKTTERKQQLRELLPPIIKLRNIFWIQHCFLNIEQPSLVYSSLIGPWICNRSEAVSRRTRTKNRKRETLSGIFLSFAGVVCIVYYSRQTSVLRVSKSFSLSLFLSYSLPTLEKVLSHYFAVGSP